MASLALTQCDHAKPPAVDAATTLSPDAGPARGARRSRRRRGRTGITAAGNTPVANGSTPSANAHDLAPDPGAATADDLALGDDTSTSDDNAPRVRPRVTETGPMLPEDLGAAPSANYDMAGSAGAAGGPLGIEPSAVSHGLNPLLGRLTTCAAATMDDNGHGPHGRVSVRLRIRNDGTPVAARIGSAGGSTAFVTCTRRVIASARFERFNGPDAIVTWGFDVD